MPFQSFLHTLKNLLHLLSTVVGEVYGKAIAIDSIDVMHAFRLILKSRGNTT